MQAPDTEELIPHDSKAIHKIMQRHEHVTTLQVGEVVEVKGGAFIVKKLSRNQVVLLPATAKNRKIYGYDKLEEMSSLKDLSDSRR